MPFRSGLEISSPWAPSTSCWTSSGCEKVAYRQQLMEAGRGFAVASSLDAIGPRVFELYQKLDVDPEHLQHSLTDWRCGYRFNH